MSVTIILLFIFLSILKVNCLFSLNKTISDLEKKQFSYQNQEFDYYLINPENYEKLNISNELNSEEDDKEKFYISIKKNEKNYSINDGIYIDYERSNNITNPVHLQFSYKIDELYDPDKFEGCNIRLTNYTIDNLFNNTMRTNNSDILLFRIRNNRSISINDKSFYLEFTEYTIKSPRGFNQIDLFFDWDTQTILFLYNKALVDLTLSREDLLTNFYHLDLMQNFTKPSKLILYNLYPNTSCHFKNLILCEDFCDEMSRQLYFNITQNGWILKLNLLVSLIFLIILI